MNQVTKTPQRADIDPKYQWKVENIYPDEALWEADCERLRELLKKSGDFQGHLGDNVEIFYNFLLYQEELGQILDKAYTYASMKKDEDNTVSRYQSMKDRIQSLAVQAGSALSFAQPEILSIEEAKIEQFLRDERVALYRKYLHDITRMRPYTLSTAEERILAMSREMGAAFGNIFSMLNNADIKFPLITNEDGLKEELSHGNYIRFMESKNRQVRKDAFTALYDTYGKSRNTLASLFSSSVKKDVFYAKTRNYQSALQASLYEDNIETAVYDNLIATVRRYLPLFWRYLDLRRRILGLDELHMYDIYVPLSSQGGEKYTYEQAKEIVLAGLAPLGEEYGRIAKDGLDGGWVDVYENVGKTSGAYSSGAYGTAPYILLNFQGNLNSVFTLAHELGHSMHSYFSWLCQPYIYSYYKIFVAEVASTVNENLLVDYMLKKARTKEEKMDLLNMFLEEFRGTVFRQTMFAEFEKMVHAQVEAGGALTAESLNQMYYQLTKDFFLSDDKSFPLVLDEQIALEWARIPHFYHAFYVYKYATGFAAASALAKGLLDPDPVKAKAAQRRYLYFLQSGGSEDPLDLLRHAGVDMSEVAPIEAAMTVFETKLRQMEDLFK